MTPTEELQAVLDLEHAEAIVDHRRAKRSKLTAFAARLLAREFAKCPDPNFAAEQMILRGWQGFKAEWIPSEPLPPQTGAQANGKQYVAMTDPLIDRLPGPRDRNGGFWFTPEQIEAARRVN